MRQSKYVLAIAALLAVLGGTWFVFSRAANPLEEVLVQTAEASGSGILDGMTFSSELGPDGKPADVEDTLVFDNGMFVSAECERRCGYPATPYFVRHVGENVEFVSETRCPNKDATLVWRGTVDNGTIKGVLTWTAARWYWTIEREFWFEGKIVERAAPVANIR